MFEIGDHVECEGREAIVIGSQGGHVPTYRLRYLLGTGRVWVRAEELVRLDPLPPLKVGAAVKIAGIPSVVLEQLPDGRYRVGATFVRAGVLHEKEWISEGWQLALQ